MGRYRNSESFLVCKYFSDRKYVRCWNSRDGSAPQSFQLPLGRGMGQKGTTWSFISSSDDYRSRSYNPADSDFVFVGVSDWPSVFEDQCERTLRIVKFNFNRMNLYPPEGVSADEYCMQIAAKTMRENVEQSSPVTITGKKYKELVSQ